MFGLFNKPEPLVEFDMKAYHDSVFGPGSWDELEKGVLERMKKRDPFMYDVINSFHLET